MVLSNIDSDYHVHMVSILETQVPNFIVHVVKVADVASLFDIYLNTCPGQGSRTIRTEVNVTIFN
jgi:predicted SPOUT superfamily RNA methylase MTH1